MAKQIGLGRKPVQKVAETVKAVGKKVKRRAKSAIEAAEEVVGTKV